ncbi:hypothetical protein [Nitrosomonas nitrosa]|uniref:hypothetical protein n=1 Tax=Nitrosomonas nitrosa TaxID=52442 RepID=UPI0023F70389|nr:hypothetical protein [Nitrosomonas nitrosa]MCO6433897.1 hypothetical protein [Nitrosomonas nitrosa]
MRYFSCLLAAFMMVTPQALASDIGVSIRIGQPGFYGELHFGGYYPTPRLIYPQPVLVWHTPANLRQPPIYMHVPPGHAKNWNKHCHLYRACDRYVYFVQESWYNNVYIPYYQKRTSHSYRYDNGYQQPYRDDRRDYHDHERDYDEGYRKKRNQDKRGHDHYRDRFDPHPGQEKQDKGHRKDRD